MAQEIINTGATANDGTGDPLRTAFIKTDNNFDQIWAAGPVGSNVQISGNTITTTVVNTDLALSPNGAANIRLNNNTIPGANNIWYLGSATNRWRGGYIGAAGLDVTGNITVAYSAVRNDLTVAGNLRVQGNIIQIGNVITDALTIQLANTAATDAQANGAGITVGANDDIATLLYNSANNEWRTNIGANIAGNVSANYFIGNGALLTGIASTYGNANVAAYLPTYTGNIGADTVNVTGNILVAREIRLGTLPSGNLEIVDDTAFNGPGIKTPGGSGLDLLIEPSGNLLLSADGGAVIVENQTVSVDPNTGALLVYGGIGVNGNINSGGNITANYFIGNGSQLTGLPEQYGNANVAAYLPTYTGDITANNITVSRTIRVGTLPSGNLEIVDDTPGNGPAIKTPGGSGLDLLIEPSGKLLLSADGGEVVVENQTPSFDSNTGALLVYGGIGVNGNINSGENISAVGWTGNLVPSANAVYSLGNSTNYWSNLWVANNTIYIGGVPLGITGNVLTVNGEAVLSNDSDSSITTTGNITANYFIGDGSLLTNVGGNTGDITFDGANISAPDDTVIRIQAKDDDSVVRSFFRLDPDNGYAEMRALSNQRTTGFTTSDWSTGEWTGTEGSAQLAFTGATDIVDFLNGAFNGSTNQTISVNGGEPMVYNGWSGGGDNVTFFVDVAPPADPTTITSIEFGYYYSSRIEIDYDDDEINIRGNDLDININSTERIDIGATNSVEIQSSTIVSLLNNSTTEPIIIRTNNGNTNQTWEFGANGNLTVPGNIVGVTNDNSGSLQWIGNSSGDGNGYTTLELVPDNTLYENDQYLVIDPTDPNHIHIRAGGTQDASAAELYLGGEANYVRVADSSGIRLQNQTRNDSIYYYSDPADFTTGTWYESGGTFFVEYTTADTQLIDLTFQFNNDNENTLLVYYNSGNDSALLTSAGSISSLGGGVYRVTVNEVPPASPTAISAFEYTIWNNSTNSVDLSGNDFTVSVTDDIRITGRDTFSLRNESTTSPITIITDYDNADHTWEFRANGNLRLPNSGHLIVSGGIVGSGASPAPTLSGFSSVSAQTLSALGNVVATGNVRGGNLISSATIFGNVDVVLGNIANTSATKTRMVTDTTFSYIQTGNGTVGSTGNIVFSPYLATTQQVVIDTASGNLTAAGNVTAQNFIGNISITGNVTGTSANVDLVAGVHEWSFDNTGNLTLPGNTFAVNYANGTAVDPVTRFEGLWTVPTGNSTQSFTVDGNNTYQMWVEGNIPNGIIAWNALVTVTNTNVPVLGQQFAWNYEGGGNVLMFNTIPAQIIGTAGAISNVEPAVSNTNVFSFGINNASGSAATVRYGWIKIS